MINTTGRTLLRALLSLGLLLATLLAACAHDTGDTGEIPEPVILRLGMQTKGEFQDDTWYYCVVNFSQYPNTSGTLLPLDSIANENRGKNWELYIMYHRDTTQGDQLLTLQRSRFPTVLTTGIEPVDAVAGKFTPGDDSAGATDVIVACRGGDVVQLIRGLTLLVFKNRFFEDAENITGIVGTAPLRVHSIDLDGDSDLDLIVVFQGRDGAGGPAIRFYLNDGNGTFAQQNEIALPEAPYDSLLVNVDPDTDANPDLVVLTRDGSGNGTVRVFHNDGGSPMAFSAGATAAVGLNPVQLASGDLDSADLDLAVANRGPDGGNGSISTLLGDGNGNFAPGPTLAATGNVTGASIGRAFGSGDDVFYTTIDSSNQGFINVYLKEKTEDFAAAPVSKNIGDRPQSLTTFDSDADSRVEAYIPDGIPGSGSTGMLIERSEQITEGGNTTFGFNELQLAYQTGREPSRIIQSTLDDNGVTDLIVPNSGSGTNGNSICLFYGLGKHNYTNVDVFWTDEEPQLLTAQTWYLSHTIGPNSIELEIDPRLFFDLTNEVPEGFIFDWMTGTSDIALQDNDPQTGEVREHFNVPEAVPYRVDVFDNNDTNPRVPLSDVPPQQDIVNWYVEVN